MTAAAVDIQAFAEAFAAALEQEAYEVPGGTDEDRAIVRSLRAAAAAVRIAARIWAERRAGEAQP